jgi:hypothetical protein
MVNNVIRRIQGRTRVLLILGFKQLGVSSSPACGSSVGSGPGVAIRLTGSLAINYRRKRGILGAISPDIT